jgi:hypothetical protein
LWIADDGASYGKIYQLLLSIDIILEAEETTGYSMNKTKSSFGNLRMNIQRLALLGFQLAVDPNGTPVPGIVLLGSYIGSSECASELLRAKKDEMEVFMALVRGLRTPQLACHLLCVCLSVPCLVQEARTTPPDVIQPFVAEFDSSLRRGFAESICSLTDAGWSKIQLPFRKQGGGIADLGNILRPAYTASIMDTAPTRDMLSHNLDTASLTEPLLPTFRDFLASYGLSDEPDVQLANLLSSNGKKQSTIGRAIDKVCSARIWPSPITPDTRGHEASHIRMLAYRVSLQGVRAMEWIKAMPSDSLKSAKYLFSEQHRLMLTEPVLA